MHYCARKSNQSLIGTDIIKRSGTFIPGVSATDSISVYTVRSAKTGEAIQLGLDHCSDFTGLDRPLRSINAVIIQ
jgi:phage-related tail fiber protein